MPSSPTPVAVTLDMVADPADWSWATNVPTLRTTAPLMKTLVIALAGGVLLGMKSPAKPKASYGLSRMALLSTLIVPVIASSEA